MTEDQRQLLRHFLAALAYRTQKAVRDAPAGFGDFDAGSGTRTPKELVRHMSGVIGYATTFFEGGVYRPDPMETLDEEVDRFHGALARLSARLDAGVEPIGLTPQQLLQGPLSDAMTHAGQIAMLRRMAGSPVASENFIFADISANRLGRDQAPPAAPTPKWMGRLIDAAWRLSKLMNRRR
jgi:hypothetical protein